MGTDIHGRMQYRYAPEGDYLNTKHGWLLERDPAAVRIVFGFDS